MLLKTKFTGFFILLFFWSCTEFIEYPLANESVDLVAPTDNISTKDSILNFWWEKHPDAKSYRFQLVSPNFDKIEKAYIDSISNKTQISVKLRPGKYSWRVRPENMDNIGIYQTRYFEIKAQ